MVADAGMLSAANLNALEDAEFSFIENSRLTKTRFDLAEHFEHRGDYFENGQLFESERVRLRQSSAESPGLLPVLL